MAISESENPLLSQLLLGCMLAAEGVAARGLLLDQASLAAITHAIGVASAIGAVLRVMPRGQRIPGSLAAALLVLTMPPLGALGLAFVILPAWRRLEPNRRPGRIEVSFPESLEDDISEVPQLEPVPIAQILQGDFSLRARTDAVMALRQMDARKAVPLLRLAFLDASEDIRLLAFAILERREKQLRSRIAQALSELEAGAAPLGVAQRAAWHRRVARDHWELVYAGFVSGDFTARVLDAAVEHAMLALKLKFDGATAILLARVYLQQREPTLAVYWLAQARRAGIAPAATAPLLAEAAFLLRRFGDIPLFLSSASPPQLRRAELAPVVEFWSVENTP
jgi:polysaccharide biosynthesis protein PelE